MGKGRWPGRAVHLNNRLQSGAALIITHTGTFGSQAWSVQFPSAEVSAVLISFCSVTSLMVVVAPARGRVTNSSSLLVRTPKGGVHPGLLRSFRLARAAPLTMARLARTSDETASTITPFPAPPQTTHTGRLTSMLGFRTGT